MPRGADADPEVIRVVHEDAQILILDKPSGLPSVPPKPPKPSDCLHLRLRAAYGEALLVHRLDADTSGIMVFARTKLAQRHLNWQFERRQVAKSYVARVWGDVVGEAGTIDLPLIVDWPNRPKQMVNFETGKPSITDWTVAGREPGVTRMALRPRTGRSHQLRVHLLSIGHPILGDYFYAPPEAYAAADRLQLHAETLGFRHPEGGGWVEYRVPAPF